MDRETTQFLRMELAKLERADKKSVCWDIFADLKRTSSCSHVHPSRVLMGLMDTFVRIKLLHSNWKGVRAEEDAQEQTCDLAHHVRKN